MSLIIIHKPQIPDEIHLSERESQVILRLAKGTRMTDIATELGLSVKSVSTYLRRVKDKTGMTEVQIGVVAAKQGLV